MQKSALRQYHGRRVVVEMDNEWSAVGVLLNSTPDEIVLGPNGVRFVGPDGGGHEADGSVIIDRLRVIWVQVS